jgi:hypothetical protein
VTRLLLSLVLLTLATTASGEDDDNTIVIEGLRRERREIEGPGRSIVIEPTGLTRNDASLHLQLDSSVRVLEMSRPNASGFSVPRMRGQEARRTSVWVGDIRFQDPWSGLPLIDELDLRAFGAMEVQHGLPSADVPDITPFGVIRFKPMIQTAPATEIGGAWGQTWGGSTWLKTQHEPKTKDFRVNFYARDYSTRGDWSWYSDNGTPWNTADDAVMPRTNNHKRSRQGLLHVESELFSLMAWGHHGSQGEPASTRAPASGKSTHGASVIAGQWKKSVTPTSHVHMNLTSRRDHRDSKDPGQQPPSQVAHGLESLDAAVSLISKPGPLATSFRTEIRQTSAVVKATSNTSMLDAARRGSQLSMATTSTPHESWRLTLKGSGTSTSDQVRSVDDFGTAKDVSGRGTVHALGAGVEFFGPSHKTWLQHAHVKTPPSMLEKYGDGSKVEAATELTDENTVHTELGTSADVSNSSKVSLVLFRTATKEPIVFVPASAHSTKAVNLASTRNLGAEILLEESWSSGRLHVAWTRIDAATNVAGEKKQLPGVARDQVASGLTQRLPSPSPLIKLLAHAQGVWRGRSWRDAVNSVEIPGGATFSTGLELERKLPNITWQAGIVATNLSDAKSSTIESATGDRGRTGYSDIRGEPLAGRMVRLEWGVRF